VLALLETTDSAVVYSKVRFMAKQLFLDNMSGYLFKRLAPGWAAGGIEYHFVWDGF
jgi:hypothetical protein